MIYLTRTLNGAIRSTSAAPFLRSFSLQHPLQISKARYDKLRLDPEALRRHLDKNSEVEKNRYATRPEVRENHSRRGSRYHGAHRDDEAYQFVAKFQGWCKRHTWVREQLPWKTHRPVLHDVKVEHHCSGCNWARRGGVKLWFQHLTKPNSWLCMSCYWPKGDLGRAMPTGYEDVRSWEELVKRRDSLMGTAATGDSSTPS